MKKLLAALGVICLVVATAQPVRIWTGRGRGPLAGLPTSCISGDFYVCQGEGCPANNRIYYCNPVTAKYESSFASTTVSDFEEFKVSYVDANRLNVNGGTIVIGTKRFTISSCTGTLTAVASDSLHLYLLNGTFVAGMSDAGSSISCSGWTPDTSISEFPAGSTPIYKWTATGAIGSWDPTGGEDWRSLFHRHEPEASIGVLVTPNATTGRLALSVDSTMVPMFSSGTAAAPATCTLGQIYIKTDTPTVYMCTSTNTYTALN